jgi:hypothetical protein
MEGYRNIMVVYGDANKRIWPTEFGWAAGGAFDPRYAYANDNSFEEQAAAGGLDGGGVYHDAQLGLGRAGFPLEPQLPGCGRRHREGAMGDCAERLVTAARLPSIEGDAKVGAMLK